MICETKLVKVNSKVKMLLIMTNEVIRDYLQIL